MSTEPLVLKPRGRRFWWTLAFMATLGLVGLAMLAFGSTGADRFWGATLTLIGFGIAGLGAWRAWRGDVVRVDETGIRHPDLGLIPWDEVVEVRPATVGFSEGLAVDVRNPDDFRRRNPRRAFRVLGRADRALGMPLLHLPSLLLPAPVAEVLARMEELAGRSLAAEALPRDDPAPARPQ